MNAFKAKLVGETDGKGVNLEEVKQTLPDQDNAVQATQIEQSLGPT